MRAILQRLWRELPGPVRTRIRGARWFASATRMAYPDRKAHFDSETAFYRRLFRDCAVEPRLVFDIGANNGEKTDVYLSVGASVIAVEPTPALASYLRERYGSNHNVTVLACAASDKVGTTTLWQVANSSAMNTISPKNAKILASGVNPRTPDGSRPDVGEMLVVDTRTLDDLILQYGKPEYIKIDVEGHEREVIAGLSHRVSLISFEANLPEFLPETLEIIERLSRTNGARFQIREHQGFILPGWVSGNEIAEVVRRDRPYFEVFVWNPVMGAGA